MGAAGFSSLPKENPSEGAGLDSSFFSAAAGGAPKLKVGLGASVGAAGVAVEGGAAENPPNESFGASDLGCSGLSSVALGAEGAKENPAFGAGGAAVGVEEEGPNEKDAAAGFFSSTLAAGAEVEAPSPPKKLGTEVDEVDAMGAGAGAAG